MSQFGGWGQFGGGFKFGGSDPLALIYYRVLKSLGPRGLLPNDDSLTVNHLQRCDAVGLAHIKLVANQLFSEIFPHTAFECIPDWERLLGVVPPPGATIDDRRDAILARWRGAAGNSLSEIRQMLYPLLRPSTAWRDIFDDEYLSFRWDETGNGDHTESGAVLQIEATGGNDCGLDGQSEGGQLITQRLNDINDGWAFMTEVSTKSIGLNCSAGIIAFRDYQNFYMLGFRNSGSGVRLSLDKVVEGVLTEDVDNSDIADPGGTPFLQIQRQGGEIIVRYGEDESSLNELHRVTEEFTTRRVGLFAKNTTPTFNLATLDVFQSFLIHETPENNVTIIEMTDEVTAASGDQSDIFFAFIHRSPDDPGTYDLQNAQRQMDKCKQAHTLILVGESDVARYDDPHSLFDRDIYGV